MDPGNRIIVALDVKDPAQAIDLVKRLRDKVGGFKIGLEFITSTLARLASPSTSREEADKLLGELRELFELVSGLLFWDGKWDDIKNTVEQAAAGVAPVSPKFINVHASAGHDAVKGAAANKGKSLLLGVTVLTSIEPEECISLFGAGPAIKVLQFARLLRDAGADGIICSPQELAMLDDDRDLDSMEKVTPGIRPLWSNPNEQNRRATPGFAIRLGATRLVIGRPITGPPAGITSEEAVERICDEIKQAERERPFVKAMRRQGAFLQGHFVLASARHGSMYVNKDALYPNVELIQTLCRELAFLSRDLRPTLVVGPEKGGIILSTHAAGFLSSASLGDEYVVKSVFAEKEGDGFTFGRGYENLIPGARVLIVEDVLTTGGSVEKVVSAVRNLGGEVVGVAALFNRGGVTAQTLDVPVLNSLVNVDIESWLPADCTLCAQGVPVNTNVGKGKEFLAAQAAN